MATKYNEILKVLDEDTNVFPVTASEPLENKNLDELTVDGTRYYGQIVSPFNGVASIEIVRTKDDSVIQKASGISDNVIQHYWREYNGSWSEWKQFNSQKSEQVEGNYLSINGGTLTGSLLIDNQEEPNKNNLGLTVKGFCTISSGNSSRILTLQGDNATTLVFKGSEGNMSLEASQENVSPVPLIQLNKDQIFIKKPIEISGNTDVTGDLTANGIINSSSFYVSSDKNLKENILNIKEEDIEKVKKVDLVQYTFKDSDNIKYGVIAQDLEKVGLQNLVKNGSHKTVDYISFLVLKIQQLENEINKLRNG